MKLVMLTAHSREGEPQHRYVATRIAAAFPDELQAIVIATGIKKSATARAKAWLKRYSLPQIASRIALRLYHAATGHAAKREDVFNALFFPDGGGKTMPRPDLIREVRAHNSAACRAMLRDLAPDIIVIYGTLIIRPDVLGLAGISAINMHTGLSPVYRGSDTIFWPLHNGEPEYVGVTVHRVDPGVDSGEILHTGKPRIEAGDSEDSLFAKAVMTGTDLLIAAIREEFEGRSQPIVQDLSAGHEYRSVDRTVTAERCVKRLIRGGLLAKAAAASDSCA